jgi:hypothetical protein
MSLIQLLKPALDAAAFEAAFKNIDAEVRFDVVSRALYSTDASVYKIKPLGVVIPRTRAALIEIVTLCSKHGCSITMRGGGTSQAGQAIGEGVIVDASKYLHRVIEVNAEERWARVEPGVVLDELAAGFGNRWNQCGELGARPCDPGLRIGRFLVWCACVAAKISVHRPEAVAKFDAGFRWIARDGF